MHLEFVSVELKKKEDAEEVFSEVLKDLLEDESATTRNPLTSSKEKRSSPRGFE